MSHCSGTWVYDDVKPEKFKADILIIKRLQNVHAMVKELTTIATRSNKTQCTRSNKATVRMSKVRTESVKSPYGFKAEVIGFQNF